jgi:hypothetical protein
MQYFEDEAFIANCYPYFDNDERNHDAGRLLFQLTTAIVLMDYDTMNKSSL